jgi:predicted nucleic acid-binding protein
VLDSLIIGADDLLEQASFLDLADTLVTSSVTLGETLRNAVKLNEYWGMKYITVPA